MSKVKTYYQQHKNDFVTIEVYLLFVASLSAFAYIAVQ